MAEATVAVDVGSFSAYMPCRRSAVAAVAVSKAILSDGCIGVLVGRIWGRVSVALVQRRITVFRCTLFLR